MADKGREETDSFLPFILVLGSNAMRRQAVVVNSGAVPTRADLDIV